MIVYLYIALGIAIVAACIAIYIGLKDRRRPPIRRVARLRTMVLATEPIRRVARLRTMVLATEPIEANSKYRIEWRPQRPSKIVRIRTPDAVHDGFRVVSIVIGDLSQMPCDSQSFPIKMMNDSNLAIDTAGPDKMVSIEIMNAGPTAPYTAFVTIEEVV